MSSIDPKLIDVFFDEHDGYPKDKAAGDTRDALFSACGTASTSFPKHLWIEPRDWPAVSKENDERRTWPLDFIDRFTNQNPTHECTSHSLRTNAECCRNRQRRLTLGPPVAGEIKPESKTSASVWLSCLSIYAEANPNQWGGAGVRQVLEIAVDRGFLPDKTQPRDWKFAHSLIGTCGEGNVCQSHGSWVPLRSFPEGWRTTAAHFKPLEIIFPESWEEAVCLVLHGWVVSVGRSGHAIPYSKWIPDEQVMAYVDSYNVIRYDSLRTVKGCAGSGSFCITSFTTPDDWEKPVG